MVSQNVVAMRARWFAHATERCMERYGIIFTEELLKEVIRQVEEGSAVHMHKFEDSTRSVYKLELEESNVTLTYCGLHKQVITFLHNGWVQRTEQEAIISSSKKNKNSKEAWKTSKHNKSIITKFGSGVRRKMRTPRLKDFKDYLLDESTW